MIFKYTLTTIKIYNKIIRYYLSNMIYFYYIDFMYNEIYSNFLERYFV